ncbi:MAG: PfkB family carbohydrate kinase [Planctomycetota bacterium]
MSSKNRVITIGLCPCWDTICQVKRLEWADHAVVDARYDAPAGKALNVSCAMAWMSMASTAAGLWGSDDIKQMIRAMRPLRTFIDIRMTSVKGRTRQNITIVDRRKGREIHLRNKSELISKVSIKLLKADLRKLAGPGSICVFAGSMPQEDLLFQTVSLQKLCMANGAKVVLDTSGNALKAIVRAGGLWVISPNVAELSELLERSIADNTAVLASAGRELLTQSRIVLISRGSKGAIALSRQGSWSVRTRQSRKAAQTVGCGDYLLAGFLHGMCTSGRIDSALRTAVRVAAAKAWGLTESRGFSTVQRRIKVTARKIPPQM